MVHRGIEEFYRRAARVGLDSVLVADVPVMSAEPFSRAARGHGVAPILLAPPNLPRERVAKIAELSDGYTYCVARKGVTGVGAGGREAGVHIGGGSVHTGAAAEGGGAGVHIGEGSVHTGAGRTREGLYAELRAAGAPPPLVGFGIATAEDVRRAISGGAEGAICGSAVAVRIEESGGDRAAAVERVSELVAALKEGTRGART
ncbi:MAG: tryptophan synthase subunit alpha [Polyangiaceae bacterium]